MTVAPADVIQQGRHWGPGTQLTEPLVHSHWDGTCVPCAPSPATPMNTYVCCFMAPAHWHLVSRPWKTTHLLMQIREHLATVWAESLLAECDNREQGHFREQKVLNLLQMADTTGHCLSFWTAWSRWLEPFPVPHNAENGVWGEIFLHIGPSFGMFRTTITSTPTEQANAPRVWPRDCTVQGGSSPEACSNSEP